jgi:hypothetical protein
MVNGRSTERPAHRVASVTSMRRAERPDCEVAQSIHDPGHEPTRVVTVKTSLTVKWTTVGLAILMGA